MVKEWDDGSDDEPKKPKHGASGLPLTEFDCPTCGAHNPCDERVPEKGTEIRCNYCGLEFKVTPTGEGKFKFKEI